MAKLLFFGTSAGTEPIPGMCHSAWALEKDGYYYWFDCGENCSRTAFLMGVDLLKIKTVCISHAHMDHVGGLGNLLWNIRKLNTLGKGSPPDGKLDVFMPNRETWEGIMKVLSNSEGSFSCPFEIRERDVEDGLLYDDRKVGIRAVHNRHLPFREDGRPLSYSYVIKTEGRKVVYSGDLKSLDELCDSVEEGCDLLLCETGHHKVEDVCRFAETHGVGKLLFTHNGRQIINDPAGAQHIIDQCAVEALICRDSMKIEL